VEPCNCQPLEIPSEEIIARAIFYSFHIKPNGKLTWKAFEPDLNEARQYEDDLSIMRTPCVPVSEAKQRAREMNTETPRKEYRAFALLHTGSLRLQGFEARDSRHIYCGHGDLILGLRGDAGPYTAPVGEPVDANIRAKQKNAGEKLMKLSTVYLDAVLPEDVWPACNPPSR
jgi:hypothetical protein